MSPRGARRRRGFVGQVAQTAGVDLLGVAMGVVHAVVLARVLGAEGRGIYEASVLVPLTAIGLLAAGLPTATTYFTARGGSDARRAELAAAAGTLGIGLGLFAVGVGAAFVALVGDRMFEDVPRSLVYLALALVVPQLLARTAGAWLLGQGHLASRNGLLAGYQVARASFAAFVLVVLDLGVRAAIVALIAAATLEVLLAVNEIRRHRPARVRRPDRRAMAGLVRYGAQTSLGNAVAFLNYRLDLFLVTVLLSVTEVGYYAVAVAVAERLWIGSQAASTVLFPRLAAQETEAARLRWTAATSRVVLAGTALLAGTLAVVAPLVVRVLFSGEFDPSVGPLRILLVGVVAMAAGRVLAIDIAARGRPLLNSGIGSAMLATNLVLNLVLIPPLGIAGAAWASAVSYGMSLVVRLVLARRHYGVGVSVFLVPRWGDVLFLREALRGSREGPEAPDLDSPYGD